MINTHQQPDPDESPRLGCRGPGLLRQGVVGRIGKGVVRKVLFIGDDWAEDHHDIEIEVDDGRRLVRARLPEGLDGIAKLHALIAEHAPAEWADLPAEQAAAQVAVGIETDRGGWVVALRAAGYQVYAINPMSAARYRERHCTSGAKSDAGDAHVLAEIVRLDSAHHRLIAGDSDLADGVKLLARAHQTAIWERTRHVLRLRSALNEFFPLRCKHSRTWPPPMR